MSDVSAPIAQGATCRWKIRAVMSALYVDVWPQRTWPSVVVSRTKQTYWSWKVSGDRIRPASTAAVISVLTPGSPAEDQHTARAQTGTQIIEGLIQLLQRDPASDQLIQRQLATQIMADQNRDVAVQIRRPEIAALDRLLADERARVERDPGTAGQH